MPPSNLHSAEDVPARHGDVEMLRRLTRDAVGEITDVRDRLRDLERSVATERASRVADRVRVNTRVDFTVTSATPRDDPPGSARGALRATTVVEAPFPNGDSLVARCVADDGTLLVDRTASTRTSSLASPAVVLDKLVYRCRVGRDAWIRLAVLGGEGQDVAATLNPLSKGASISGLGSSGSSVLARCRGTAACASREFADGLVGLAAGVFLGDRASDPAATPRAMAQATFRPGTRAAAAISASAAAPAAFDEDNPVGTPDRRRLDAALSAQALAAVGERTLVAAWASSDGGDWGVAATAPPEDGSPGWGVVCGAREALQAEAFLRFGRDDWANSRTITPGVVARRDSDTGRWDASAVCKVQWLFSA